MTKCAFSGLVYRLKNSMHPSRTQFRKSTIKEKCKSLTPAQRVCGEGEDELRLRARVH